MKDQPSTPPVLSPFAPKSLNDAIHGVLSSHPDIAPGHRGAVLAAVNEQGVSFGVKAKLDEQGRWVVDGEVSHDWSGGTGASVKLTGSF